MRGRTPPDYGPAARHPARCVLPRLARPRRTPHGPELRRPHGGPSVWESFGMVYIDAAAAHAHATYSWSRVADRYLELYRDVIHHGRDAVVAAAGTPSARTRTDRA